MLAKLKNCIGSKFGRLQELIVSHKIVVAVLVLFAIAFAILIIVTATAPDPNRLLYTEKEDGTLEVEGIKNTYRDGWFCKYRLAVPESVKGKQVTSVARLDSAKLQEIVLPDSVTEIKAEAFAGCSSLKEITLGSNLQTVGDGAWKNCPSLSKITIPQSVRVFGKAVFDGTPIEFHTAEGLNYVGNEENPYLVLIGAEDASLGKVRVHENAKVAARACFEGSGIAEADTGDLTCLPERMFAGCNALKRADISAAIELGANCFEKCAGLTEIDFCEKLAVIGDRAFLGCDGLKEVHFEDPSGWKVSQNHDMSGAETVSGLEDPEFAARALTDIYVYHAWKREG